MTSFAETFKCKYPIAAMAMNKVSDLRLAVAIRQAGGLPSLSVFNYFVAVDHISVDLLKNDLDSYYNEFGDLNILISTGIDQLLDPDLYEQFLRVSIVEVICDDPNESQDALAKTARRDAQIAKLRQQGTMVVIKALDIGDIVTEVDGAILKGPDGAGRVGILGKTLEQMFNEFKTQLPHLKLIVAGGIGSSDQVKYYIDNGAFAVGVGTLFAACEESKVSMETKQKMISATNSDIQKLSGGAEQNALVFGKLADDNYNNTRGLMAGIKNPTVGHIFAGKGIDKIDQIKPVKEVIAELVKDLTI